MRDLTKHHQGSRTRRRGAALVLVMIFGVGALMLVTTMLSLSDTSAKSEGRRHQAKALSGVVRYGIGMALTEINRSRSETGYADPTGNGFGTILTGVGAYNDGLEGWPVRSNGTTGVLLGRFRSIVRTEGTSPNQVHVLSVVAVFPSFEAFNLTAGRTGEITIDAREMMAAEIEIRRGRPPFDRNALSIRGDADVGGTPGVYGESNKVDITGTDPTAGAQAVPAVNVSDPSSYATFLSNVSKFGTVTGVGGSDAATVTNEEAGLLNEANLLQIAAGLNTRIATIMSGGTRLTAVTLATLTASGTPLNGNYYIDGALPINAAFSGSGTLVIAGDVTIGAHVDWDGEIIVANENGARLSVESGSSLDVFGTNGVLAVQGVVVAGDTAPTGDMGLDVKGRINVVGALTILGNTDSSTLLIQRSGSRIDVDGIMTIMGNNLNLDLNNGAETNVNGSLALITPSESVKGVDIKFENGVGMTLKFYNSNFDSALSVLGNFFDPNGTILPVSTPSYWERSPKDVLASQTTTLGSDTTIPHSGTYQMAP